ncbi:MAG: RNB domain-containing ribonuclease [Micromonosporaceae bacterium]
MANLRVRAPQIDFGALRRELKLPDDFPPEALREAEQAAGRSAELAGALPDRTEIELVTIDPPDSLDLDQAVCIVKQGDGYRVHYAIADVLSFVPQGSALDRESWERGQTIYFPDARVALHPLVLSEGGASLLPDQVRPAVLWTIDVDAEGEQAGVTVERVAVRSRAKLSYEGVQADHDAGKLPAPLALLPEVGERRIAWQRARDAVSLPLPEQEITRDGDGWRLELRAPYTVEDYNAQISLLTGMAAATIMLDAGVGLLRTLPKPQEQDLARVRAAARALGAEWPDGGSVAEAIASVDPATPRGAAALDVIAELLRGSGYTPIEGQPPADPGHAGVGAPYAHVTAPLRRLADRYATEVCLAVTAGQPVSDELRQAIGRLPGVMKQTDQRANEAERAAVELTEAVLLADRVGETFAAAVLDVDQGRNGEGPRTTITLEDPPVQARCDGDGLKAGERIQAKLIEADPTQRRVRFTVDGV